MLIHLFDSGRGNHKIDRINGLGERMPRVDYKYLNKSKDRSHLKKDFKLWSNHLRVMKVDKKMLIFNKGYLKCKIYCLIQMNQINNLDMATMLLIKKFSCPSSL